MRVVVSITKDGLEIFNFEAPVLHGFGLEDITKLAFDDLKSQRPDISLFDSSVEFHIRNIEDAHRS